MGDVVAAMGVGEEALGALGRPLDRPSADPLRGPQADDFFGIDEDLGAESAADIGRDDAQLVFRREADEGRDHQPRHMRVLARRVEREVIVARVVGADRGARLHGVGDQAVVDEVELGDMRGVREGGIGRALVAKRPLKTVLSGATSWICALRILRLGGIDDMRQHVIVDLDQRRRRFGLLPASRR